MKNSQMKRVFSFLLILAMALSLAACNTGTPDQPSDPSDSGSEVSQPVENTPNIPDDADERTAPETLTIGTEQDLGAFLEGGDSANCFIGQMMIYDKIFYFDSVAKEYKSDILESWDYVDAQTFVMHVREGVTFANGNALTASDILFTLKGFIERNSALASQFVAFDFEASYLEDDMTVVIKTSVPYGPMYDALSVYVYDEEWVAEKTWSSDAWTTAPNGSGPYELTEYVSGAYAVFALRDDYWGWDLYGDTLSLPKTVTLKHYGEASTMYIDLEMGALDVASGISAEDLARSYDNDDISAMVIPSGDVRWFAMNIDNNEYLANEKVRLAIAHAVDWEAIGIAAIGDKYIEADSIISVKSKYYEPIGMYEFNPELAKQLLEEAGYQPGEVNLLATVMASGATYMEMVQGYLREVGINITVKTADFGSAIAAWLSTDGTDLSCQISATGVPTGEPWISLQQMDPEMGSFPGVLVSDEEAMSLLRAAVYSVDEEVRQENYTKFAQYMHDHALAIPTYQANGVVAWRNEVIETVTFNMYRLAGPQNMIWS